MIIVLSFLVLQVENNIDKYEKDLKDIDQSMFDVSCNHCMLTTLHFFAASSHIMFFCFAC